MESSSPSSQSTESLQPFYRRALTYPPLDLIMVVIELARSLWLFLQNTPKDKEVESKPSSEGKYRILNLQVMLHLKDPYGHRAILTTVQRVEFLQDTKTYIHPIWQDGQLTDYHCSLGTPVKIENDGDRGNILISFDKPMKAGSKPYMRMKSMIAGGFTQDHEVCQVELRNPANYVRVEIYFPAERPCRRVWVERRSDNQVFSLNDENRIDLEDGGQQFIWDAANLTRFDVYTFKWDW